MRTLWLLAIVTTAGACVDFKFADVCDFTAKTCVIHGNACGKLASPAPFLSGTASAVQQIGDGWTFYFNPLNISCKPGVNCTYATRTAYGNLGITDTMAAAYIWKINAIDITFSNITITSLYKEMAVFFYVDDEIRQSNLPTGPRQAVIFYQGTRLRLYNVLFTSLPGDPRYAGQTTINSAAVVLNTPTLTDSYVTINCDGYAVCMYGYSESGPLDITNTSLGVGSFATPPALAHWPATAIVAAWLVGTGFTIDADNVTYSNGSTSTTPCTGQINNGINISDYGFTTRIVIQELAPAQSTAPADHTRHIVITVLASIVFIVLVATIGKHLLHYLHGHDHEKLMHKLIAPDD